MNLTCFSIDSCVLEEILLWVLKFKKLSFVLGIWFVLFEDRDTSKFIWSKVLNFPFFYEFCNHFLYTYIFSPRDDKLGLESKLPFLCYYFHQKGKCSCIFFVCFDDSLVQKKFGIRISCVTSSVDKLMKRTKKIWTNLTSLPSMPSLLRWSCLYL